MDHANDDPELSDDDDDLSFYQVDSDFMDAASYSIKRWPR